MEVVAAAPGGGGVPPFHDHDVREWSHIDSLTGVLERARLETDHWTANTNNTRHNYNKVVDSRARTNADGALQQRARRQLEVYQSQIPGGHLQVIKTHTVSSSRWTNKSSSSINDKDFENLQLSLTPSLDLSSQKSKANVGRGVGRRPPSRPRTREETSSIIGVVDPGNSLRSNGESALNSYHRVPRLCHQVHDNASVTTHHHHSTFNKYVPTTKLSIHDRQNGDGSVDNSSNNDIESITSGSNDQNQTIILNGHSKLTRTKSTSSEDLHLLTADDNSNSTKDLKDLEQLQSWRRTSKIRRSLQYPKQNKTAPSVKPALDFGLLENRVSVRKIREELEKGRRLNTALRGNNIDLQALDQILQTISSSSSTQSSSDKSSSILIDADIDETPTLDGKKQKRNSFVTAESLQEVRGRLRRTSCPTNNDDDYKCIKDDEETSDDGIASERKNNRMIEPEEEMSISERKSREQSRVRSYVYGMENNLLNNKKSTSVGTGSLESRSSKLSNGNSTNRNEDWYNRRKSYGFEQVHNQDSSPNSISQKDKNCTESSTDSGICRSSEIVLVPTPQRIGDAVVNEHADSTTRKEPSSSSFSRVKKISSIFDRDGSDNSWNKRFNYKDSEWKTKTDNNSTTITIPIVSPNFADTSWNDLPEKDVIKRHSIAVDESRYDNNDDITTTSTTSDKNRFRRTSLGFNEKFLTQQFGNNDDDLAAQNRKSKKVEFCKTEVHFAAESGKVNIVETDEKPPPTHNFRRRRRNSGPLTDLVISDFDRNGLPVLHFGDSSYEKTLLGVSLNSNAEESMDNSSIDAGNNNHINDDDIDIYHDSMLVKNSGTGSFPTVTVNTHFNTSTNYTNQLDTTTLSQYDERKDTYYDNDNIKGILKNKPIKPKPYHLGENEMQRFNNTSDEDNNSKWGVRLKPIPKDNNNTPPIWKSTITLHNTIFPIENNNLDNKNNNQPELQKLLTKLKPTTKPDLLCDQNNRNSIKITTTANENRQSSSSAADRINLCDDTNRPWAEHKIYSTKVNFGDGQATVVGNESFNNNEKGTTWPKSDKSDKDNSIKQILNKGLVVRIGREDFTSKHTVCSKTTTTNHGDDSRNTTTTKITIDLSPSPSSTTLQNSNNNKNSSDIIVPSTKRSHSFKSTSLILNTIKNNNDKIMSKDQNAIPQQLEALKKLYDDIHSDSDADKEVQLLMDKINENELQRIEDDNSSVVSGSWSKMRAYKTFNKHANQSSSFSGGFVVPTVIKPNAKIEQDDTTTTTNKSEQKAEEPTVVTNGKMLLKSNYLKDQQKTTKSSRLCCKYSPDITTHKAISPSSKRSQQNDSIKRNKLSSPSSVRRNSINEQSDRIVTNEPNNTKQQDLLTTSNKEFDTKLSPNLQQQQQHIKYNSNDIVLRQPKKSEMTYFGVMTSPKPTKKLASSKSVITNRNNYNKLSDKPDLLQHMNKIKTNNLNETTKHIISKPRKQSPERQKTNTISEDPIYENLLPSKSSSYAAREFDSTILEELTRAADQILQAVNGFTDEDSTHTNRLSGDDYDQIAFNNKEPLSTISESKSWKRDKEISSKQTTKTKQQSETKSKLRYTSSTSSIDDVLMTKGRRKSATPPLRRAVPATKVAPPERLKKKVVSPSVVAATSADAVVSTVKATTKARRLQRASSREALLQSHGSSSEDLTVHNEVPVRKPRQIKKTKSLQLTVTNGLMEINKKTNTTSNSRKSDDTKRNLRTGDRTSVDDSADVIHHKTIVSTIRGSTKEKSSSTTRDRSRLRSDSNNYSKSRSPVKAIDGARGLSGKISDTRKNVATRETVNHRISTANIKKCHRAATNAEFRHQ